MTNCPTLDSEAQEWANRGVFEHAQNRNGAGENIGNSSLFDSK